MAGARAIRGANGRALVAPDGREIYVLNAATAPYEGATTGRRASHWYAPGYGPASTVSANLSTLRNRTRAGYRNTPWIRKAVGSRVANEVGCGITPRSRAADPAFREAADALFDLFVQQCDPAGELNFYGQLAQISACRNMSGETLVRRRPRRLSEGLAVPLQLQVLEPDFLPEGKNETLSNGNVIVNGVEFNNRGRRVAYWLYAEHPAEPRRATFSGMPRQIPAADVIHHFLPVRPGQVRGEPLSAAALLKTHTFDSYDDAELVRKQTRAPYTGVFTRQAWDEEDWEFDPFTGETLQRDANNQPQSGAEPGTLFQALPGESFTLFNGDDTGAGYKDFMRQQLLAICAAHDVPYELVTGDWSAVNDRLVRAILQEYRRALEAVQDHLLIYQVCRRVWEWFTDAAVFSGALSAPGYAERRAEYLACEWRPHTWPYVHPEQDVNSKLMAIEGGITSRDAVIAESGWEPEEIDRQQAEGEARRRRMRQEAGLPEEPPGRTRAPTPPEPPAQP